MARFTHSGTGGWCKRTVESSGSKLSARLWNISPAAIWQEKSYIEPLIGFAAVGHAPTWNMWIPSGDVAIDASFLFSYDRWELEPVFS